MARARSHILRIGVTGGIGSGKSEVCRLFRQRGIPVLEADVIARKLSHASPSLRRRIIGLLGSQAYRSDGSFNRSYVASRIFSTKRLQKALNAIVHPAVLKELKRRIEVLAARGTPVVIVEAALIFEAGYERHLDAVVVVDAREDLRIRRVMKRDGVAKDEVRQRMKAQWPAERKLRKADYVIRNNGSRAELRRAVEFLCSVFHRLRKGSP